MCRVIWLHNLQVGTFNGWRGTTQKDEFHTPVAMAPEGVEEFRVYHGIKWDQDWQGKT